MHATAEVLRLEDLLRHAVDGVLVIDQERRFVTFSDGCERITGFGRESVLGAQCRCHDVLECHDRHGRSLAGALCPSLKIFRGDIPSARQRMSIRRDDGALVWVETTYSPIRDASGHITSVLGIMRDITEQHDREEELREAALLNRDAAPPPPTAAIGSPKACDGEASGHGAANSASLDARLEALERSTILAALQQSGGQRTEAARRLGVSRSRLYRRMEALGILTHKAPGDTTA